MADAIARNSDATPQSLAEAALALCAAGAAGVAFRAPGQLAAVGDASGAEPSRQIVQLVRRACERVLETGKRQLLAAPSNTAAVDPTEVLAISFGPAGRVDGALWVAAPGPSRRFDAEDARLLESLCALAASIGQAVLGASTVSAAMLREEERQRFALEAAGMIAWEWDLAHDLIRRSAGVERLIGPGREFGSREEFMSLVHPIDRASVEAALRTALEDGGAYFAEFRLSRPDGEDHVWVADQGRVEFDDAGRPRWLRGVVRDITLRKRAQQDVTRRASELQAVMDSVPAVVFLAQRFGVPPGHRQPPRLRAAAHAVRKQPVDDRARSGTADAFPGVAERQGAEAGRAAAANGGARGGCPRI